MIKNDVVVYATAFLLSLGLLSFSSAQEIAKPTVTKVNTTKLTALYKQAREIIAQDLSDLKHPVKPMLWKVEGNGLKKSSYLFGSIHVYDHRITTLHPEAEAAYQQADTVATEIPLENSSLIQATKMRLRNDGKILQESIGDNLFNKLDSELKEVFPSLLAKTYNNSKTWVVILDQPLIEELITGSKILDQKILDRALKDNKKRWCLEKVQEQMGGFNKLTEAEQTILLKDSLTSARILKTKH